MTSEPWTGTRTSAPVRLVIATIVHDLLPYKSVLLNAPKLLKNRQVLLFQVAFQADNMAPHGTILPIL